MVDPPGYSIMLVLIDSGILCKKAEKSIATNAQKTRPIVSPKAWLKTLSNSMARLRQLRKIGSNVSAKSRRPVEILFTIIIGAIAPKKKWAEILHFLDAQRDIPVKPRTNEIAAILYRL